MARPRTLRLVFSYQGDDVRLLSSDSVEMRPLPSDPVEQVEDAVGFWYELRDRADRPLYRRITENPMRTSTEVLTDDPERPIAREEMSEPRGEFVLFAPDLDEAETLVFVGAPPGPSVARTRELARFELK